MGTPGPFALSLLLVGLGAAACTKPAPEPAPPRTAESSPPPAPEAGAPPPVADARSEATTAAAAPDAGARPADPQIRLRVVTIGMHVGGGPYDEVTKEPMKRSVEPHFADLARCWTHVAQPRQADAGVDLVIEARGGRARVSNPRTTASGEGFVPCVVSFFEGIEFLPPKNGRTVVSYSVRFLP